MNDHNNFAVFDIEANNWKEHLITGYFDGENYATFELFEDFMYFYLTTYNTPSTIYAHWGGIFDFLFCIDFLFSQNPARFIPINIILQGKKILKFDIIDQQKEYPKKSFVDSSGLFPFSLEKLTTSFDVTHKKLPENIDFSKKLKITKKLLKYLEHDCKGLHECLVKFSEMPYINEGPLALTRSGQSFNVFKKHFAPPKLPNISNQVKAFARQAYFGGRTEIFKPLFNLKNKKSEVLNVYDINSLYPSVMHDYEYPSYFIGWSSELDLSTFSINHVVIHCPHDIVIPILGIKYKEKFIFPTGTFEGFFTNIELQCAIDIGYKLIKVIKVALFDNGGFIFKNFIAHFYKARLETKCPVQKILFKDLMNHLYGRLAINEIREQISIKPTIGSKIHSKIDYGDYEIRLYSNEKRIFTYSNPVLSCFVTSYARIRLYEFFERVNFDVHYCDTDSIFTTKTLPNSKKLGEMKLEYKLRQACFLLPKTYGGIKTDGDFLLKMKGFRNKNNNMTHIGFDDLVQAMSGDIRLAPIKTYGGLAGLKRGMKKGDVLHVLPDSTKQLKAVYDKRIIYKEGSEYKTKPHQLCYQQELF